MKVFVRNRVQSLYYAGEGKWVPDRSAALDFDQVIRASEYARAKAWNGMEVVLAHDDPVCDLVLPINSDTTG